MKKDTVAGACDSFLWSQNFVPLLWVEGYPSLFSVFSHSIPLCFLSLAVFKSTFKMKLIIVATLLSAVAAFTGAPLKTAVSYFMALAFLLPSCMW
jgi:hypothetical protein